MPQILQFLKEVKNEMVKVVWPSRRETVKMTVIVVVFSVAVSVFLGAIDYGLTKVLELVLAR
ncbi:MAG: preprotein translocase subunit SecE [Patescibacteria group bacterium]|nr:preprotein translocase subunit SecE [Patescibacteria group bacterium]